jgi:Pyridoxamine 5'-phosphate oxidase
VALTIGPKLQAFFDQTLMATVCTMNERGAPEMTPIWYEYFDGFIWFNGAATREWLKRMESSRRATFFLLDRDNNWKWAQVWGRVVETADDVDATAFKRLGLRYDRPIGSARDRRYVKVEITSVKGRCGAPSEDWDVRT